MDEYRAEHEDQASFRDYILKGRSYFLEVLRYWYIPAFLAVLVAGYKLVQYLSYTPVYSARVTFIVDEDEGGSASGLTGMLSQFGLGNVRPARYNLDKILELSRSRRVVEKTLLGKITIDGKEDFIANHILRIYELHSKDANGKVKKDPFRFTHDSLPAFTRNENEILLSVYSFIIGPPDKPEKALLRADYNEETNIMSLTATTINEVLSYELAHRMFESLSDYYISKAIEKSQKTYKIVSTKRDSVLAELRSAEYSLANFKDTHRGMMMRVDQLSELRLQREVSGLTAMYLEVVKNTEVADFSLRNKTPFIQVVDSPILPIAPAALSLPRQLIMGLLIGGFLGVVFVVGRRIFRDLMVAPQ